ncbi:MFS transporter [Candidatus Nomurabacteria bacterium]|nr:MFS transporter [Candidatus Nomurabacteria bacterium]MCB9818455.1 MFS transporter [Candidatus Nomurabacteria bacterium]
MVAELEKRLRSNIWKYTVMGVVNKRIFAAIISVYYLTIPDVTVQTVGLILLVGNVVSFFLEIPSGYISDKLGHKQTLVMSSILMVCSTILFLFANSVTFLMLASTIMCASWAFKSGTGSAFMHETLRALNIEHEYSRIMGKVSAIGFSVPIILTVLVPFLVSISYKVPFLIALIMDVIGLFVVFSLVVPPVTPEHVKEVGITNFKQVMKEAYRLNFFSVVLLSAFIGATATSFSMFRAPYQEFVGISVIWFGVLFGLGRGLASLMLAYSGRIKNVLTLPSFYLWQIFLFGVLYLIAWSIDSWLVVAVVFVLANAIQWGFSKIDEGYQLQIISGSKFKATLLSVYSQLKSLISGAISFVLGTLILHFSYQKSFLILGIFFIIVSFSMYWYIIKKHEAGDYGRDV